MAGNKTRETDGDVTTFIASVENDQRRQDAEAVLEMMQRISGEPPKMWGESIVGFGKRHMVYDSGRELDWFHVGFSPRKQATTLYVLDGTENYDAMLDKLGKHTTGKGCLYIKRLDDVDMDVLEDIVSQSVEQSKSGG